MSTLRRLKLFLGIVWRRWEPADPQSRIDARLAWKVARIIHG